MPSISPSTLREEVLLLVATDVAYDDEAGTAKAVAVGFEAWDSDQVAATWSVDLDEVHPYEPGSFYKRELPCLLAVLDQIEGPIEVVIVDGHAWLNRRPGLGQHLFEALDRETPVVGVAKNPFKDGSGIPVRRGQSQRPLYVSASGMPHAVAANCVRDMHGAHRLPAMLRRVDALTKGR